MELEEITTKIQGYIKEYSQIRDSGNISLLLNVKDNICAWSFRFAELTADIKIDYNDAYFIRRINVAKSKQALINKGSAIGKADVDSMIENEEAYKAEQEYESLSYKADLMLRQTNVIIRAIEQRVSYLKFEASKYENK